MKPISAISMIISLASLIACTPKYGIKKAHAFIRENVAGTIPVDDKNNPKHSGVNIQHIIYVETKINAETPQWNTAWVNEKPYSIHPVEITTESLNIGKSEDYKEDVVVSASPGTKLWQLILTPKESSQPGTSLKDEITKSKIVLVGKYKQKEFSYSIKDQKRLASIFHQ